MSDSLSPPPPRKKSRHRIIATGLAGALLVTATAAAVWESRNAAQRADEKNLVAAVTTQRAYDAAIRDLPVPKNWYYIDNTRLRCQPISTECLDPSARYTYLSFSPDLTTMCQQLFTQHAVDATWRLRAQPEPVTADTEPDVERCAAALTDEGAVLLSRTVGTETLPGEDRWYILLTVSAANTAGKYNGALVGFVTDTDHEAAIVRYVTQPEPDPAALPF